MVVDSLQCSDRASLSTSSAPFNTIAILTFGWPLQGASKEVVLFLAEPNKLADVDDEPIGIKNAYCRELIGRLVRTPAVACEV